MELQTVRDMMKPIINILDAQTGEIIEREMNNAEFEQYQKDVENRKLLAQTQEEIKTEKAAKRVSAEAKLKALGLTADDLAALGL